MEIELRITHSYYDNYYHADTVYSWQYVWDKLLRMCYLRDGIQETIITSPNRSDDLAYYERRVPKNYPEITFDYVWKEFCKTHRGDIHVVPELKRLHVPERLLESLGVNPLFDYAFPNCRITFWE